MAANEAQPQGNQVPGAPQTNEVQDIPGEQPPAQPVLDANGLEVICLPFFSYFASVAAAFHVHVSACSYLSLSTPSSLLSSGPFFCVVYLHSLSFTLLLRQKRKKPQEG